MLAKMLVSLLTVFGLCQVIKAGNVNIAILAKVEAGVSLEVGKWVSGSRLYVEELMLTWGPQGEHNTNFCV